jgi:hypothetical protein
MPSQSTLLGAAGEHFVLCQLLRRGYIAALAPIGVPNADILITDVEGYKLTAIQVKTRRNIGADKGWHMKPKHETLVSDSLFYCFVDLGEGFDEMPRTLVVPSSAVASAIREAHAHWLKTPGKKGQAHKDSNVRRFTPDYSYVFGKDNEKYGPNWTKRFLEAWDSLGTPQKKDEELDKPQEGPDERSS